jgi:hypothetical protein
MTSRHHQDRMEVFSRPFAVRAQLWVDASGVACEEANFAVYETGTRRYLSVRDLARALTGEDPTAEEVRHWYTMQEDEIDDPVTTKYAGRIDDLSPHAMSHTCVPHAMNVICANVRLVF